MILHSSFIVQAQVRAMYPYFIVQMRELCPVCGNITSMVIVLNSPEFITTGYIHGDWMACVTHRMRNHYRINDLNDAVEVDPDDPEHLDDEQVEDNPYGSPYEWRRRQ